MRPVSILGLHEEKCKNSKLKKKIEREKCRYQNKKEFLVKKILTSYSFLTATRFLTATM